ncbi:MAG: molybdopterin-dependent oxidoreductase [Thermodesulfobacteriota bacterium]
MSENIRNIQGFSRRLLLRGLGALGFFLSLPRAGWSFFKEHFPVRTVEKEGWTFDPTSGRIRYRSGGEEIYHLVVDGLVEAPVRWSYNELRALPQVEQVSDFHCVEGWSVADLRWGGIRFEEILKKVKPTPGARFVVFHSLGETRGAPEGQSHYVESFPISQLLNPEKQALLALDLDGKPLPFDHGAPLRVISPFDLAYKSIKYVTRIELAADRQEGWWTLANPIYPVEAPVPPARLRRR